MHINVRMTAIKLSSGGLLIYSPIAPTRREAASLRRVACSPTVFSEGCPAAPTRACCMVMQMCHRVSASSCCQAHLERANGCTEPNEACFTALRTLGSCVCRECIDLVKEIGAVEHVVLTTHAYEHKIFVAPFARKFPGCKVSRVLQTLLHIANGKRG